jgi:ribonuclease P protein component
MYRPFLCFQMEKIRLTFKKEERLKSTKAIAGLFEDGENTLVYPLKIVWKVSIMDINSPAQAAFTVSSKIFGKSVDRNLLKRRMREAYRHNKLLLYDGLGEKKINVMFIYIAREELDFSRIEKSMVSGFKKIIRATYNK